MYSGVNRCTGTQAGVIIWIQTSISKRKTEVNLNNGKGKLSFFGLYTPEEGKAEENENFYNYRKYETKLIKIITSCSQEI
jgi:hypothetical protein